MLQENITGNSASNVVLADADLTSHAIVSQLLGDKRSFAVSCVSNQEALLTILGETEVDCVIVDRTLGGKSSFEMFREITEGRADPPAFIMLTADGSERVLLKAFRCGFDDYLNKETLTFSEMAGAVRRAVARRRTDAKRRTELLLLSGLAQLDRLTGLPNRKFMEQRIEQLVAGIRRYSKSFAVVKICINELEMTNDNFGHFVGDLLVRNFASRLKSVARACDTIGHFEGGAFLYLIDSDASPAAAELACRRLANALSFSVDLESLGVTVSATIGAAIAPADGRSTADLLEAVDEALHSARSLGNGHALAPGSSYIRARHEKRSEANRPQDITRAGGDSEGESQEANAGNDEVGWPSRGWRAEARSPAIMPAIAVGEADGVTPSEGDPAPLVPAAVYRDGDRRSERRQRVFKQGIVVLNEGQSTLNCTIRDLSAHGAHITIEADCSVHPQLVLVVVETGERFTAQRRWQKGRQLGLRLLGKEAV